jgi:O-antigen/teichoic acid export membrane protein
MPMLAGAKEKAKAILRWSERYTKTDLAYAAKGGFWLTFGSMVGSLMSLVTVIAFANLASKETYGSYKYVLAIAGTLSGFALSGLGDALMGAAARGKDGTLRLFVRKALAWNLLIAAAAFAGAAWYFWHGNAALGAAFALIGVFIPITQATGLHAAFLRGRKLFRTAAFYGMARAAAPSAALLVALFLIPDAPDGLAAVFLGTGALASTAAYLRIRRTQVRNGEIDPDALRFGGHVSAVNFLGGLAANFDKIIIFQTLGAAPTAVYALAQALPDQLDGVASNLRTLALPKFAAQSPVGAFGPLARKTAIAFLALVPVVAVAAFLTPLAYRFLFPSYQEAVPYALVLLLAQLPIGAAHLPHSFITAQKDVRGRYAAGLAPVAVALALMLLLVKPYGLMGVALAKVITKYCGLTISLFVAWRICRKAELTEEEASPASPPA